MATTKIIQSLERAMSILELFQNNVVELSLKDISERLELNKSTTFGLVNSLSSLGYLMKRIRSIAWGLRYYLYPMP